MELKDALLAIKAGRLRRTNVLTKGIFGRMKTWAFTTPDTPVTSNVTMSLEAHFVAVRIGIPNMHTEKIVGAKACFAVTTLNHSADYINNVNPTGGEWLDLTFNGAPSVELPPAHGPERYSVTWSDLLYVKSVPDAAGTGRPMVKVRVELPGNVPGTVPALGIYTWRQNNSPRHLRAVSQRVGGVTDKASFTGTNPPTSPTNDQNAIIPLVQYVTEKEGHQMFIMGDSIQQGVGGDFRDFGHWQMAASELSTPDRPVDYVNASIHSQQCEIFAHRLADIAAEIRPTVVTYSPFSVNDVAVGGIEPLNLRRVYGNIGRVTRDLDRLGIRAQLIMPGSLPVNSQFKNIGAGDQRRRDFNAWLATVTGFTLVPGYVEVLNGEEVNGQTLIKTGLTTDNGHPNEAGHAALKVPVKAVLSAIL